MFVALQHADGGGSIEGIAATFGVDWVHLGAQIVSFGIVCVVLYLLAYKPILKMLETMATLVPGLGWLLPVPFYFMELLVGLVQALVFMLLTAVFTLLICQHHEDQAAPAHG